MNQIFKESRGTVAGADRIQLNQSLASTTQTSPWQTVPASRASGSGQIVRNTKSIENAVYNHIRAVRALGRTEVFPSEVAAALGLTVPVVMRALTALQRKGVKFGK